MNLIEAIKSGRPYRRACWDLDAWRPAIGHLRDNRSHYGERLDDLLANDWEIQEPTVTITRTQFWEAYAVALKEAQECRRTLTTDGIQCWESGKDPMTLLAKRLGLGDP